MRNWKRLISVMLALVLVSTMFTGLALAAEKEEAFLHIKSIKVLDALKKLDPIYVGWENYFDEDEIEVEWEKGEEPDKYWYYRDDSLVFSSSDNAILKVTKSGEYEARKAGKVTVTVSSQKNPSIKDTFDVTVKSWSAPVTKISFSSSSFEVAVGEYVNIWDYAIIEPTWNGTYDAFSVKTSDPDIAAYVYDDLAGDNVIKGKKAGTVTVTVTIANEDGSEVSGSFNVTVTEKALKSLSFTKSSLTINKAEKTSVNLWDYLTVSPANVNNLSLKWESSNEEVATVSGGTVSAKRPGTATITAKSKTNPEISASIEVIVVESEAINEVKFDENTVVLYFVEKPGKADDVYNSQWVGLNIQPAAAASTIKTINWRTSNAKVAIPKSGDENGVYVQAVGKGRCTITCTFKDTSGKQYSASFKVKVTDKSPTAKLNKKSVTLKVKKSFKLSAKDADKGTTLKGTWKSSDKKVAKVNSKGKVTGVKPGRAIITFTPKNKTMNKVTCVVTVK